MALQKGDKAPAFELYDQERKLRTLSEFAGKTVVLAFYPGAFTGVCTKEMCSFRDAMAAFNALNAAVVGVSVDGPFANAAFAKQNNLAFPLLSDTTRAVSKAYGGVHEDFAGLKGYSAAKRSVFVVDSNGSVKYAWVSDNPGVEPDYAAVEAAAR